MKNILKIFSSENLKKNTKEIIARFPVTILIILMIAGLFFTELHYHNDISDFYNDRILVAIFSLIMTFVFSIGVYLSSENSNYSKLKKNLFQLIPLGFWIIFYNIFSLDPDDFENFLFFLLSFAWIIAFLFFAPYSKKLFIFWKSDTLWNLKQSVFYTYFYNISTTVLISFIFAWVLFGLGAIWIYATDTLFDLDIDWDKTYWNWVILSLSVIAPLFALTQIPNKKSFIENDFKENTFFSFLIKFVATPFIYLYFFILYAYSVKVLLNFNDWPRWEVSWLVIGFSIFGYLAYIFSYIFEEKNEVIKSFRKIFPFAVIPQIFMLFYAIYLRINQYDITVNRYFVVVFWLWLFIVSLYFVFSRKKQLIILPATLTLFIIIISIIPKYNVYSLPEARQLTRLETNLKKAWIMSIEGFSPLKITPLKKYSDISEDLSKNIYSWIDYLCDFDSCSNIKELFPEIYKEILKEDKAEWEKNNKEEIKRLEKNKDNEECNYNKKYYFAKNCYDKKRIKELKEKKYKEPRKWQIVNKITEKIKVKSYFTTRDDKVFFEYSKNYKDDFFPLDIKKYSKIYRVQNYDKWENKENYWIYDISSQTIKITQNKKIIIEISTKELEKKLLEKFWKNNKNNINKNDLIFELEWWKYKIFFENIVVKNPDYKEKIDTDKNDLNTYMWWFTRWYLLVK